MGDQVNRAVIRCGEHIFRYLAGVMGEDLFPLRQATLVTLVEMAPMSCVTRRTVISSLRALSMSNNCMLSGHIDIHHGLIEDEQVGFADKGRGL